MRRALVLAALLAFPNLLSGQATSVLRVTVTLPDDAQTLTPVSRHVLLISDNPATTVPKRVLTGPNGTVSVTLSPGSYKANRDRGRSDDVTVARAGSSAKPSRQPSRPAFP